MEETKVLGKGQAIASLVFGILSLLCVIFIVAAPVAIIFSIVALVLAKKAKKLGYEGGARKAGKVLGIIGLVLGIIITLILLAAIVAGKMMLAEFFGEEGYQAIINYVNSEEGQFLLSMLDEDVRTELVEMIENKDFVGILNAYKNGDYNELIEMFSDAGESVSFSYEG